MRLLAQADDAAAETARLQSFVEAGSLVVSSTT